MVAAWTALTAAKAIDRNRIFIGVVSRTRLREVLCNCAAVDFCSCRDLLRLIQAQKRSISCALATHYLLLARVLLAGGKRLFVSSAKDALRRGVGTRSRGAGETGDERRGLNRFRLDLPEKREIIRADNECRGRLPSMSTEIKKEIALEIAHILFVDFAGYSKLSINEQRAVVDELTTIVRG